MQFISFKASDHRITEELYQYTRNLLALGIYTNKEVADLTRLGKNTVKDIDKQRLQELYTIDDKLIKPEKPFRRKMMMQPRIVSSIKVVNYLKQKMSSVKPNMRNATTHYLVRISCYFLLI